MDQYRMLFEVMSKICGHVNPEMRKTSSYALEAFLKQVQTHCLSFATLIETFFLMLMMSKSSLLALILAGIRRA